MRTLKLQKTFEYFFDNFFDICTIIIAGFLVVLHQVRPFESDVLLEWILAVLGLIAVSGLWERSRRLNRIEKITKESRDLVQTKLQGQASAKDFFIGKEKGHSEQSFATADDIYLSGMTLTRTTREYLHIFGERLKSGANIKIMVVEPKPELMDELVLRSFGNTTAGYWKTRIDTVVDLINVIAKTPGSTGKLEIGFLPFLPSFGFTLIDYNRSHATCYVELYHHRSAMANPTFILKAKEDPNWYQFFQNQFETMWNMCRVIEMPLSENK